MQGHTFTGMKLVCLAFLGLVWAGTSFDTGFLAGQKKFERVRNAIRDKEQVVAEKLEAHGLRLDDLNILVVAYKAEGKLDLYAKKKAGTAYKKIDTYEICASSGDPGPKRKQGDYQVPEGFYHIDRYNPTSAYYLSLGINYPNLSDKRKSTASNLGGDIFIHGSCVTIGCLPMTDDKIKEIYLYAIHARNNGQAKVPVYIFPFRMTESQYSSYKAGYEGNADLLKFWANLKTGHDKFFKEFVELNVSVNTTGDYTF